MIITVNKQELTELYSKASKMYHECMKNPENFELRKELSIPLEEVEILNSDIKIVFDSEISESFSFEIALTLCNNLGKIIGRYMYKVGKDGLALDDALIFY